MASFEIPDGPAVIPLRSNGDKAPLTGTAVYAVTNKMAHPVAAKASVQVTSTAKSGWFAVKGDIVRQFAAGENQTVEVAITVPPDTPAGDYKFRLRVTAVNDPDNDHMEGPVGTFSVTAGERTSFPWWAMIVGIIALALVGGLVVWLLQGRSEKRPSPVSAPTPTPVPVPSKTPAAFALIKPSADCHWLYWAGARGSGIDLMDGPPLRRLRFGDFDGDGKTDVFTSVAQSDGHFRWFVSRSGAEPFRELGTGVDLSELALGDFDGDGKTDIFFTTPAPDGSSQWRFSPGGTGPAQDLRRGVGIKQLAFGDFDGDGTTDVLTASPDGAGQFRWQYYAAGRRVGRVLGIGPDLPALRFGDFDGDGATDIFFTVPSTLFPPPTRSWMIMFKGAAAPRKTADGDDASVLRFGDFDGDGKADALATYPFSTGVYQWKYSAGANSNYQDLATGPVYSELETGDFDGNGATDLFQSRCN